ncbi:MAG: exodeoxyribonuclease VII small subunit [bacterium]
MSDKIKFEDLLSKLESIVEKLEKGDLSLEESLSAYEEGIKLSRLCLKQLDEAERKIEMLTKGENGSIVLQKFEAELEE